MATKDQTAPVDPTSLTPTFEATEAPIDPVQAAYDQMVAASGLAKETRTLTDAAINCSIDGCDGIVRKDFVLFADTSPMGLCPKREQHTNLAAAATKDAAGRNPVSTRIHQLITLGRAQREAAAKTSASA